MKKIHLVQVTELNNNKFYDMEENSDGTFKASWGRIGVTSTTKNFPLKQWDSKYREKLRKGYIDQSRLFITNTPTQDDISGSKDPEIDGLVKMLRKYAAKSVDSNYTIDSSQVTLLQVQEAQTVLDNLSKISLKRFDPGEVNPHLINLYRIIPRRMGRVQDHLLNKDLKPAELKKYLQEIISSEQDTLDVMAGQVQTHTNSATSGGSNLLDQSGLQLIKFAKTTAEYKLVQSMMGSEARLLQTVYGVVLDKTDKQFTKNLNAAKDKTTALYWHGSRNENWWSILTTGLLIRPTNAVISGKMFGYGIYGADKFQKSYGYTSGTRSYWAKGTNDTAYLGIFQFHMGKTLTISRHESWCSSLTFEKLRQRGEYDSLTALGGADLRNNEYIVYQEPQLTIKYLIKVKGE